MVKLSNHHFTVTSLIVQFQTLQKVINVADILVFLNLAEDGQELVNFQLLLVCNGRRNIKYKIVSYLNYNHP